MPAEAILWGARGQAKVLRECLAGQGVKVIALFENDRTLLSPFQDVPLYYGKAGFTQWLAGRTGDRLPGALVAIGGDRGKIRLELQDFLASHGLAPLIAQHRSSVITDTAAIGVGSQILAHAVVGVDAVLGRACIINTAATLDHECILGDAVHLCPGSHLAGCVTVGSFAMIGTGAAVVPRISVGEGAIVGAGSVIIRDVEPYTVVVGNPGRVVRQLVER